MPADWFLKAYETLLNDGLVADVAKPLQWPMTGQPTYSVFNANDEGIIVLLLLCVASNIDTDSIRSYCSGRPIQA